VPAFWARALSQGLLLSGLGILLAERAGGLVNPGLLDAALFVTGFYLVIMGAALREAVPADDAGRR
jgi:hypothetical protein